MSNARVKWLYYDNEHPGNVLDNLKRYIRDRQSIETTALNYWYVGQTDDPEKRLVQHQNDYAGRGESPWTDMFVVYGHRDIGFVTDVENGLIEYLRSRAERMGEEKRFLNAAGSRYSGNQTFHVYVLVDDHPNSASGAKQQYRDAPPSFARKHCFVESNKRADASTRETTVMRKFREAIRVEDDGYSRVARCFYVGMTNNPGRRFAEHQIRMTNEYGGKLWQQMRVVYQTPSLQNALDVETLLIDYALERHAGILHNAAKGRFAMLREREEHPYFYVYYLEDRG